MKVIPIKDQEFKKVAMYCNLPPQTIESYHQSLVEVIQTCIDHTTDSSSVMAKIILNFYNSYHHCSLWDFPVLDNKNRKNLLNSIILLGCSTQGSQESHKWIHNRDEIFTFLTETYGGRQGE